MRFLPTLAAVLALCTASLHAADDFLPGVKRIVFLGDSITHAGGYVENFDLYLFVRHPERKFEVIDIGLSSETVSGLSETLKPLRGIECWARTMDECGVCAQRGRSSFGAYLSASETCSCD